MCANKLGKLKIKFYNKLAMNKINNKNATIFNMKNPFQDERIENTKVTVLNNHHSIIKTKQYKSNSTNIGVTSFPKKNANIFYKLSQSRSHFNEPILEYLFLL